jgi:hypothetical protein
MSSTGGFKEVSKPKEKKHTGKAFLGKLQPVSSRVPANPDVNYAKGGSDFRCPWNTTSLGKQVLSGEHLHSAGSVKFSTGNRFNSSQTIGVGPASVGQYSSFKKQSLSSRETTGSMNFGTSSRDDAWKLYAVYTAKRF